MRDGDEGEEEEEERQEDEEDEETGRGVGRGDEDGVSLRLQGKCSAEDERGENRDAVGVERMGGKGGIIIGDKVHSANDASSALRYCLGSCVTMIV